MGRSDTGVTTGWTEGKLRGELRGERATWNRREGGRKGNCERASFGRSDTGMTTGWTDGKPWEIAWGELRWEEATY